MSSADGAGLAQPNVTDSATVRRILGHYCSGLTVVSAVVDEQPVGLTCQSFFSVSLDPPLVAVCVRKESTSFRAIRDAAAFSVNVLAAQQREVSMAFGRAGADKGETSSDGAADSNNQSWMMQWLSLSAASTTSMMLATIGSWWRTSPTSAAAKPLKLSFTSGVSTGRCSRWISDDDSPALPGVRNKISVRPHTDSLGAISPRCRAQAQTRGEFP